PMRTILLIAILSIYSPLAFATCGSKTIFLSGVAVQLDNRPAADVLVGVAWKEDGVIGGPAMAKSDSEGRYSIPIKFQTYSSTPGKSWYECKGQLKEVMVSAYDDTHYAPPIPVHVPEDASHVEASPLKL